MMRKIIFAGQNMRASTSKMSLEEILGEEDGENSANDAQCLECGSEKISSAGALRKKRKLTKKRKRDKNGKVLS